MWRRVSTVGIALLRVIVGSRRGLGARLATALGALGGVWAKVGQMLSTRYDLLPADICEALRPLQGRSSGVAGNYGRAVVTRELGTLDAFARFDDTPVAAATIGQVHRATLASGRRVAVKILRPGVEAEYAADLRLLGGLARVLAPLLPRLSLPSLIAELEAVIAEELDLRFEAAHMRRMRKVLKSHDIRVPKVFGRLCTSRLLVTAWVDGVVMSDLLARADRETWLAAHGLTGKRVARRLLQSLQRQIFDANRFHGDLHPGNLIVSRSGRLHAIDFGSTSTTELGFLQTFTAFVRALAQRDHARAADQYCLLCIWPPSADARAYPVLRRALAQAMAAWTTRAEIATLDFAAKSVNQLSIALMTIVLQAGGSMQWEWLRITRAFSTMEATLGTLWPRVNYLKEIRRYLAQASSREALTSMTLIGATNILARLLDRLDEYLRLDASALRLQGVTEGL
jgi:ubiquinone biosynthesis protein